MDWREAAEKNNRPRIIWKKILGRSLRPWLIIKFKQGYSKSVTWSILLGHINTYFDTRLAMNKPSKLSRSEVIDRAEISLTARWSEFKEDRK